MRKVYKYSFGTLEAIKKHFRDQKSLDDYFTAKCDYFYDFEKEFETEAEALNYLREQEENGTFVVWERSQTLPYAGVWEVEIDDDGDENYTSLIDSRYPELYSEYYKSEIEKIKELFKSGKIDEARDLAESKGLEFVYDELFDEFCDNE